MSATWTITFKELSANVQTLRFGVGFVLCAILIPLSVYAGLEAYVEKRTNAASLAEQYAEKLAEARVYSFVKPRIVRLPDVLQVISVGVSNQVGNRVDIHLGNPPFIADQTAQTRDNPLLGGFLLVDTTFVVTIVISLLGILFGYDAIAGEKESGSLRQLLSNQVSRPTVVLAKVLGGVLTLAPILASGFLISALIMELTDSILLTWADRFRIALVFLLGLVYGTVFLLLGMLVSCRTHRSSTALMLGLFAWTAWVIVLPNLALSTAERLSPLPSRTALDRATGELYDEEGEKIRELYTKSPGTPWGTVSSNGGADRAFVISRTARERYEKERIIRSEMEPLRIEYGEKRAALRDDYLRGFVRQAELAGWLSRLSPAFMYGNAARILCRSDAGSYLRFMDRCRQYRREIISYFQDRQLFSSYKWITPVPPEEQQPADAHIAMRTGGRFKTVAELQEGRTWFEMIQEFTAELKGHDDYPPLDLSDVPAFRSIPEPLEESVLRGIVDLLLLLGLAAALLAASYVTFLKYDVR